MFFKERKNIGKTPQLEAVLRNNIKNRIEASISQNINPQHFSLQDILKIVKIIYDSNKDFVIEDINCRKYIRDWFRKSF